MVDAGQAGNQDRRQTTPETPQTGPAASGTSPDASQLGVKRQGLTATEVLERRRHFGENRLPEEKGVSIARLLINQVKSPLVYIILTAAGVSLALREYGDFWIILVVVVIDVILGFFQEYQTQRTYVALKGLLKPTTTVIRDGQRLEIEVWELVPGDLVLLNSGEKVPADGQVLDASRLALDESILTGESEPVVRGSGAPVFMGTTVLTGRATLGVEKTGTATELGQIAASLSQQAEADTPFQIRLKAFSRILTRIVVGFTILILAVGLVLGREFFDMLRTAIILAIAAVPEGLLIAVTVILVLGMRKILARQGLVKKLLAVETLGSVTVICTDKTGTLTEGQMRVNRTDLVDPTRAIQTMVFCNDLEGPVDITLWDYAAQQLNQPPQELVLQATRLAEASFTSETKYMIVQMTGGSLGDERVCFLKGAPEIVLRMCQLKDAAATHVLELIDDWADDGLRLLGLAYRTGGLLDDHQGYHWAGLVGLEDPVRDDVILSIQAARRAGIAVKMITGDYRRTAERIAQRIGLIADLSDELTLEGDTIAQLSEAELQQRVRQAVVFARIRPQDKFRIVTALQQDGEITAMIGDGVNDAPALKRANIGVVVGTATDVAKETADLILTDNRFSTIVAAIEEGRIIFTNVRKVVAYTLSNSFAEVLTIFVAMILRWPAPLIVAQILWIHLICDGPSDIVLGFEPKEDGIMDEPPRPLREPILTRLAATLIVVISVASAAFTLFEFNHYYLVHQSIAEGRSVAFASLALNSMVYIFAYRSMRLPLHRMNKLSANPPLIWSVLAGILTILTAFAIPGLRYLLGLVLLAPAEWTTVISFALLMLLIVEAGKAIAIRLDRRRLLHKTST